MIENLTTIILAVILGVIIGLALPIFKQFNYVMWLEHKLAKAREDLRQLQLARQQPWLTGATTEYHLQKKITQLMGDLTDSSAEIVLCHTEIESLRTRIKALEANVSKSVLRRLDVQLGDK